MVCYGIHYTVSITYGMLWYTLYSIHNLWYAMVYSIYISVHSLWYAVVYGIYIIVHNLRYAIVYSICISLHNLWYAMVYGIYVSLHNLWYAMLNELFPIRAEIASNVLNDGRGYMSVFNWSDTSTPTPPLARWSARGSWKTNSQEVRYQLSLISFHHVLIMFQSLPQCPEF